MNSPIKNPKEFFEKFCKATGFVIFDPTDRACVITRSLAHYRYTNSVMIEWEGSPPRFPIYYQKGCTPIVMGKPVKERHAKAAIQLLNRFLAAHPAGEEETTVWIGVRYKDRPRRVSQDLTIQAKDNSSLQSNAIQNSQEIL